ncbi:type II secretion system protein [Ilumatobacter coccineus]|nr:type II secretion system protein [Ilumatobacter coccineus]
MNKNQDKGFTLVELLIVIVILGILATVTVFAVRGITDQGQENACAVERRTLDTAIESYYAQNQSDPATLGTNAAPGDLVPDFLKTDVNTANWTFVSTAGPDGIAGNGDDLDTAVFLAVTAANDGACEGA